jgi:hypothetical protein
MFGAQPARSFSRPETGSRNPGARASYKRGQRQPLSGPAYPGHRQPTPRCCEKGCIFPATGSGTGRCLQHDLEELEPALFNSCQPTMLLLDQAKFGLPDLEGDYSRARDRRRLAALREEFLEEVA